MSRTRHEAEKLRARQDEIEDLGQEKQQKCLCKMGLNPDDRKCHPCNVAERVTREGTCWVPGNEWSMS
jgi:hypothetical protein